MVVATAQQQPPTVTSVLDMLYGVVEREVVSAAEAMPEDKYSFAPTHGEFSGVRTFAEQVKHIGFANHLYFGPLMGETIDAHSLEENPNGPAALKTKADQVTPLPKPVSPFLTTRLAIAMVGAFHPKDHYGQMVEYLRMNGIVPPESRPRSQEQQSS